jgi:glutamate-1-semialdehyde 2,1-aminomutase
MTQSGQSAELGLAIDRYIANNPKSRELFARARQSMPGGNTRTALHYDPFPLYVESSAGAFLRDVDGHEYLDVLGEFTAGLYGHSDPTVRNAAISALDDGVSNGGPSRSEILLAELICCRFPSVDRVRFCNSGTEANLFALTLSRIATGRSKCMVFWGAYHGGVFVFAGGGSPVNAPFNWVVCRFNDNSGVSDVFDQVGHELAAVIVEPMMCNAGCIPAKPEFLDLLRERCSRNGAILIFDEVVTSRMSEGGLQKLYGVTPDLTTFGKYLGAGFSFGAFGGRGDLLDLMDPSDPNALPHAGTFNNNAFSMAVGFTALDQIFTAARAKALLEDGEALRANLNKLSRMTNPRVQFTGCGSVMNIHFWAGAINAPEDLVDEPKQLIQLFHLDMLEAGIYAARRGQINLSLPMGPKDFEQVKTAVGKFLERRRALF